MASLLFVFALPFFVVAVGCSQQPLSESGNDVESVLYIDSHDISADGIISVVEQSSDAALSRLLLNEFASARDRSLLDIPWCIARARESRDIVLVQRCYTLAEQQNAVSLMIESAKLWLQQTPDSQLAINRLGRAYILDQKYRQALELYVEARKRGIAVDVSVPARESVFLYGDDLSDFIELHKKYLRDNPSLNALLLGETVLQTRRAEHNYYIGNYALVLDNLNELLQSAGKLTIDERKVSFERPYLFKARSLIQLGKDAEAIETLEQALQHDPGYIGIRLELAELLLKRKNYQKAEQVVLDLLEKNRFDEVYFEVGKVIAKSPLSQALAVVRNRFLQQQTANNPIEVRELALLRLSIIAQESGNTAEQKKYLHQIRYVDRFVVVAISSLAELTEQHNGKQSATNYFSQAIVQRPDLREQLLQAQAHWLSQTNRKEAIILLDGVIHENTYAESLLYSRGLMHAFEGNIESMEKDFKLILKNNPGHVDTLNAYGYTLVDSTDRIDEGMKMIKRAFAANSERPAIVDSLGWAYFRQGKLHQARVLIHWAYSHLQDAEIGAHYGEILWELGYTEEAKLLLNQELQRSPDSPVLKQTIKRLFGSQENLNN